MKKIIIASVVLVLAVWVMKECGNKKVSVIADKTDSEKMVTVDYKCDDNKTVKAIYFNDKVELQLSDKRNMLLIQGISASGTRYTNSDQSVILWSKGNTAMIEESGKNTFNNCSESRSEE